MLSDTVSAEELKRPLPQMEDPFFLNEKPTEEGKKGETQPGNEQPEEAIPTSGPQTQEEPKEIPPRLTEEAKGEKPFPYQFVMKRKKENPVDFMSIFGKLDVTIPFLQAVRLPPLGKFIKEFIVGKAQEDGKIMADVEAAAWCDLISSRGLTDEEIEGAITEFCQKSELAGSVGALLPASMEEKSDGEQKREEDSKKNPLPTDTLPPQVELKMLPANLKYAYLGEEDSFPVIINSGLTEEQEAKLLTVLSKNKKAIGWSLTDLVGISPDVCMHHIRLEEGAKAHRDSQRKVNPNMREEIPKEILKLLSLGIIYSTSHGMANVYRLPKLNTATRKDHFPLPFIDQMLERLAGRKYFCFLDGYCGYFQIYVNPEDQDKTTFTCPFGTYAYRRMPYGLCNAPEGIVLGHVVLEKGIQVDQAKDFAKIAQPLTRLLQNEVEFIFDEHCKAAFNLLKEKLISTPIIQAPNWNHPFEVMCDASDYVVGAILGQKIDGKR
ncbi:uncharacterized protein LOC125189896 [Salvia hispanica]|uniref:uncharacterized protein LOC125189896 n=1 Tax=Salvia hispanica TaxID=49212 RepID=UPI00200975F0|nr:uncharacterized protein LOC125189896 [Salvia hispanica]